MISAKMSAMHYSVLQPKVTVFRLYPPTTPLTDGLKEMVSYRQKTLSYKIRQCTIFQEPLNEKIASILQSRLNYMPFVDYDLVFDDEQPLSVCENFITSQTELISAYSIYGTLPKEKNVSSYEHFKRCCEIQGIANTEKIS